MRDAYEFGLTLGTAVAAAVWYTYAQGPTLPERMLRLSATILYILIVGQLPLSCAMWLLDDLDAEAD